MKTNENKMQMINIPGDAQLGQAARAAMAVEENGFMKIVRDVPRCEFNEADCGGVFDGFCVVSDADPGM